MRAGAAAGSHSLKGNERSRRFPGAAGRLLTSSFLRCSFDKGTFPQRNRHIQRRASSGEQGSRGTEGAPCTHLGPRAWGLPRHGPGSWGRPRPTSGTPPSPRLRKAPLSCRPGRPLGGGARGHSLGWPGPRRHPAKQQRVGPLPWGAVSSRKPAEGTRRWRRRRCRHSSGLRVPTIRDVTPLPPRACGAASAGEWATPGLWLPRGPRGWGGSRSLGGGRKWCGSWFPPALPRPASQLSHRPMAARLDAPITVLKALSGLPPGRPHSPARTVWLCQEGPGSPWDQLVPPREKPVGVPPPGRDP